MTIAKKTKNQKFHISPRQSSEYVWDPTPDYFPFSGFETIHGNNNTLISLGRDRLPTTNKDQERDSLYNPNSRSGNSDRQAAGAIDIVVGRGAPFPVQSYDNGPVTMGPLYKTIKVDPAKIELDIGTHPGYMMDAARIYISQMCDPDSYFGLSPINLLQFGQTLNFGQPVFGLDQKLEDRKEGGPNPGLTDVSAIVVKADKVRLHARQNIKIVTKGAEEQFNSQGKSIVSDDIGIHLVAGNGKDIKGNNLPQHPMLLGSNVVAAFDATITLIEELTRTLDNFLSIQQRFNEKVSFHMHHAGSGPTLGDFVLQLYGPVTMLETLTKGQLQTYFGNINLSTFKNRFLSPATKEIDGHNNYICSNYNTVN